MHEEREKAKSQAHRGKPKGTLRAKFALRYRWHAILFEEPNPTGEERPLRERRVPLRAPSALMMYYGTGKAESERETMVFTQREKGGFYSKDDEERKVGFTQKDRDAT